MVLNFIACSQVYAPTPDLGRSTETNMPNKSERAPGTDLIEQLREIRRRREATGEPVNFPGEGGERRFRLW
jgi:hypothetical protein